MRWLFLLLLVLNIFYYVWHQQEAPLRAKDVTPLALYRGGQQDIRLLSESANAMVRRDRAAQSEGRSECLYLGGLGSESSVRAVEQRLTSLDVKVTRSSMDRADDGGYWLQVAPESRRLVGEELLQNLANEFNELKHKIMPCEGIATVE